MSLTHKEIRALAGSTIYSRGEDYYQRGMVQSFTCKSGEIRAEVRGSGSKNYEVKVSLGDGRSQVHCTCPYDWGRICKHGVAVLLYWLGKGGEDRNPDLPERKTRASSAASSSRTGESRDLPSDKIPSMPEPEQSLEDYLYSSYETARIRIGVSMAGLQTVSDKGIPVTVLLESGGRIETVSDLGVLISPNRYVISEDVGSRPILSTGQLHVLQMLKTFFNEAAQRYYSSSQTRRIQPLQFNMILDAVSQEEGCLLMEMSSNKVFSLTQEPPIGLRVTMRTTHKGKTGVKAELVDPLQQEASWRNSRIFPGRRLWLLDEQKMTFRGLDPRIDYRFLLHFYHAEQMLDGNERQHFLAGILPKLKEFAEVIIDDPKAQALRVERHVPRPRYEIDVKRGELAITLAFDYGGRCAAYPHKPGEIYFEDGPQEDRVLIRRDLMFENHTAERMVAQYQCVFDGRSGQFFLSEPEAIFEFLTVHVPVLQQGGEVFLSDKARALYQEGESVRPRIKISGSGIDWFAYDLSFTRGGQAIEIPEKRLRESLAMGRKFVRLKNGEFVRLDSEAFDKVGGLLQDFEQNERVMPAHVPFILEGLTANGIEVEADADARRLYEELKNFKGLETTEVPAVLKGVLRDYQTHGVNWLAFLKKFRFGGILADEMGLGKTLQALTLIQKDTETGCEQPSLIVCPTTLVWNWEAEVKKFLPQVRPLVITGKDRRELMKGIPQAGIVITSYALLRRDIEEYHKHRFHYVVLDEAQNIKNRHTINARVAKQLNADYRLALTGTPLENSIADIWSIFDFLMPSFLGNYDRFRLSYETPIVKYQDSEKLKTLSRKILPFVLRRQKKDVMTELPDKIEQISYCELEPTQAKLYAAMVQTARGRALEAYRTKGFHKSRMLILTLLLRLRQICCHPQIAGIKQRHQIGVSAKTDLLKEMLSELLSSGHKVLIFSQFVEMLKILRQYLKKEGVTFEYLDGQTKDRRGAIERFNTDPSVKVFLLSLKVGGLGLNLTSADTVILYEPWWNPAVEQQAIDRAHRMGQKNSVLAYRLIAKGTIEEKMLELQARKKNLLNSLVVSEETMAKKMGWEDIKFLLDINE